MSTERKSYGTVPLKPGVTFTEIMRVWSTFVEMEEDDDPPLPIVIPEQALAGWLDPDLTPPTEDTGPVVELEGEYIYGGKWGCEEQELTVKDGQLEYSFYTEDWETDQAIDMFLDKLAKDYASAGWIDFDADEDTTTYGADDKARAGAWVMHLRGEVVRMQQTLLAAETRWESMKDLEDHVREAQLKEAG